jgi:RND family efflux transporter MFP subunit
VEALPARFGRLPQEERLSGVARARNQVTIRAEIGARIVEVLARNGDAVERGQVLVRLRDDELREQVRQSEAALTLAEAEAAEAHFRVKELEAQESRARALAAQDLGTEVEREIQTARLEAARAVARQTEARVQQALATRDERRSALGKTLVRAPIAGRVGRRNAEVGMLVEPGAALFELGDLGELTVEVPLTEGMLGFIQEGHAVRITSPAFAGGVVDARLSRISPFLSEGSFSTTGEIDVANPGGHLRPGMFVTVDVLYGETREATLVPLSALWDDPASGRRGVFVLPEQEGSELDPAVAETPGSTQPVEFREVRVLAEGGGTAGVADLEPGRWVVTVGQHLLSTDDDAVARVRPTSWVRVLELQGLQREDLLRRFLDEQQAWARERGARPPDNTEFAGEVPPEDGTSTR